MDDTLPTTSFTDFFTKIQRWSMCSSFWKPMREHMTILDELSGSPKSFSEQKKTMNGLLTPEEENTIQRSHFLNCPSEAPQKYKSLRTRLTNVSCTLPKSGRRARRRRLCQPPSLMVPLQHRGSTPGNAHGISPSILTI